VVRVCEEFNDHGRNELAVKKQLSRECSPAKRGDIHQKNVSGSDKPVAAKRMRRTPDSLRFFEGWMVDLSSLNFSLQMPMPAGKLNFTSVLNSKPLGTVRGEAEPSLLPAFPDNLKQPVGRSQAVAGLL